MFQSYELLVSPMLQLTLVSPMLQLTSADLEWMLSWGYAFGFLHAL